MLPSKWLHIYSVADAAWKLFGKGAPVSWQTSDPGIEDDLPKISATPFLFTARPKKMELPFFWWVGSQPTYLSSLFDLSGFLPTAVKFFNAMTRFARFESLNQTQFSDEVCLSSSIIWDKLWGFFDRSCLAPSAVVDYMTWETLKLCGQSEQKVLVIVN